ncbi:MAG: hypothetical protein FWF43_00120 [Propionibacteriaceae bacterium]|nr:hypothetical protein [Propionibacteriaceae bacterium]
MDAPLDRLGNKRFVLPIVGIIGVFCVLALVLYPMLHAAPKDVPFAIVNLDEGLTTPQGQVNVGDSVVSAITTAPSPISWTQLDDQMTLNQAMDNNNYYGAIILPDTLTETQLAIASGVVTASHVQLIINQGKNATLASAMQSNLTTALQQKGLLVDVTVIHAADIGGGALGTLLLILPLLIMMPVVSIMIFFILRPPRGAPRQVRAVTYVKQLVSTVVMSALVAGAVILMATWVGSLTIPAGTLFLFLWLAAFCVMTLFLGALDIAAPLGGLVIFVIFACGLSSAVLAPEMLPSFWRTWFYPWVPQHFIGGGVSSIVSMGDGMWNSSSGPLAITAGVGIVLMLVAVAIGAGRRKPQVAAPVDHKSAVPPTTLSPSLSDTTPHPADTTGQNLDSTEKSASGETSSSAADPDAPSTTESATVASSTDETPESTDQDDPQETAPLKDEPDALMTADLSSSGDVSSPTDNTDEVPGTEEEHEPEVTPPPVDKPDASDTSDTLNQTEKPDSDPETTKK